MRAHQTLAPVLALALAVPAAAQDQVPTAFRSLKPHQVVEAVVAERRTLSLSAEQQLRLDSLHLAIRSEPHRYVAAPVPGKAHEDFRMRAMISRQQAYARSLAILTPDQRKLVKARFAAAEYRLPVQLQPGAALRAPLGDPLRHNGASSAPVRQSTRSTDPGQDPMQHHFGTGPTTQGHAGNLPNPMTHR
jgi:hypothetical protein